MLLDYCGVRVAYDRLLDLLAVGPHGTPGRYLLELRRLGLSVTYGPASLAEVEEHLEQGQPCIALVRTRELPYWSIATDHAVVVIGLDKEHVFVNDPYFEDAPQRVPIGDFVLAWLEFDYRCGVIRCRKE